MAHKEEENMLKFDLVGINLRPDGVQHVDIQVIEEPLGYSVWVNVDGICHFRAKGLKSVNVDAPNSTQPPWVTQWPF